MAWSRAGGSVGCMYLADVVGFGVISWYLRVETTRLFKPSSCPPRHAIWKAACCWCPTPGECGDQCSNPSDLTHFPSVGRASIPGPSPGQPPARLTRSGVGMYAKAVMLQALAGTGLVGAPTWPFRPPGKGAWSVTLWKVPHLWAPPSLSQSAHHSLFPSIITTTG